MCFWGSSVHCPLQYTELPEHKGFKAVHCATKACNQSHSSPQTSPSWPSAASGETCPLTSGFIALQDLPLLRLPSGAFQPSPHPMHKPPHPSMLCMSGPVLHAACSSTTSITGVWNLISADYCSWGWRDRLVGKGACRQPELEPLDPNKDEGTEPTKQVVLWLPEISCDTTHSPKYHPAQRSLISTVW